MFINRKVLFVKSNLQPLIVVGDIIHLSKFEGVKKESRITRFDFPVASHKTPKKRKEANYVEEN